MGKATNFPCCSAPGPCCSGTACVYLESWDEHCERYGTTTSDVIATLESAGFTVYRTVGTMLRRVPPTHTSPQCENLIAARDLGVLMTRLEPHGFAVGEADA